MKKIVIFLAVAAFLAVMAAPVSAEEPTVPVDTETVQVAEPTVETGSIEEAVPAPVEVTAEATEPTEPVKVVLEEGAKGETAIIETETLADSPEVEIEVPGSDLTTYVVIALFVVLCLVFGVRRFKFTVKPKA